MFLLVRKLAMTNNNSAGLWISTHYLYVSPTFTFDLTNLSS